MAKSKALVVRAPRTSVRVVKVPQVRVIRAGGRAIGRGVRRGFSAAARVARDEKHTIVAVLAAAGVGLLKRTGTALPHIEALGVAGTYGLGAWMAARYTRNQTLAHVATGLLSVAAFRMASGEEEEVDF
jgi:hypothetical protein